MEDRICVGAIAGAFGVRGEVRLKSFTADPAAIAAYSPLTSEDGTRSFAITLDRPVKGGFAARLSGVTSKEAADALQGTRLYARRDQLPSLPDDEYYHADLIGLTVLEIHGPGLKATVLLPFTRAAVPTVDLAAGRIIADPPDGLF